MTLKELANLKYQRDTATNPNVPPYAIPRATFNDRTAGGLTKAILTYCHLHGIFCQRTGNEGRFREGETVVDVIGRTRIMKGTWIPGNNNGVADLTAVINGKYVGIEIKIGRDRQSDAQKKFEQQLVGSGGIYMIVHTWPDFIQAMATVRGSL